MYQPSSRMFRAKSLERLSSPENLDRAMSVIVPKDWIPLATLGSLVTAVLLWSVLGRLPVNVLGRGAFVDPKVALGAEAQVIDVQALGTGILLSFNVNRGDSVEKGQLLGIIDQPELKKQLQMERDRLNELLAQKQSVDHVVGQQEALDQKVLESQRKGLLDSLRQVREIGPLLKDKNLAGIRQQRLALAQRQAETRTLVAALKSELLQREKLKQQGLITDSSYLGAQKAYFSGVDQLAALDSEARALDIRETEVRKASMDNASQITEYLAQLRGLDVRANSRDLDKLTSTLARTSQISEIERRIAHLEEVLVKTSEVRSETAGRVLELTGIVGEMVTSGNRLASIKKERAPRSPAPDTDLSVVAYFTIGDGTRITKGMRVQITPDTVKREEFGGIVGTVYAVSEYPVTFEGVQNIVYNPSIASELYEGKRTMEVFIKLSTDAKTASGYRWTSSRGPNIKVSVGTTSVVRIMVEEKPPITFLLPVLRPFFTVRGV